MKKIKFKNKRLLYISISAVSLIALTIAAVSLVKNINKSKDIQTSGMTEENYELNDDEMTIDANEVTGEEIDLNELEENPEENNTQTNTTTNSSASGKNNNTTPISSNKTYYIKVNYGANVVTVYKKDSNGNYTVPVKAMVCSTGTATPRSGTYGIKSRWEWLGLFGNVYGHYATQINGNILFHSVPYLRKRDPASLEYWEYDKLGTSASMGCIRLTVADAKWIYNNVASGTLVEFYSSGDPGPLGKPSAQKISGNAQCRDWDPTDSNPNNPWHSYKSSNTTNNNANNNSSNTNVNNVVNSSTNNTITNNTTNTNTNNTTGNTSPSTGTTSPTTGTGETNPSTGTTSPTTGTGETNPSTGTTSPTTGAGGANPSTGTTTPTTGTGETNPSTGTTTPTTGTGGTNPGTGTTTPTTGTGGTTTPSAGTGETSTSTGTTSPSTGTETTPVTP